MSTFSSTSELGAGAGRDSSLSVGGGGGGASYAEIEKGLLWDEENAEEDDFMHNPDGGLDRMMDKQREWAWWPVINTTALAVVVIVLVGLFAGYVPASLVLL